MVPAVKTQVVYEKEIHEKKKHYSNGFVHQILIIKVVNNKKKTNLLSTTALAFIANDVLHKREFPHGSTVQLLQRNRQLVDYIFTLTLPAASPATAEAAAKEHVKEVHGGGETTTAATTFLQCLFPT